MAVCFLLEINYAEAVREYVMIVQTFVVPARFVPPVVPAQCSFRICGWVGADRFQLPRELEEICKDTDWSGRVQRRVARYVLRSRAQVAE